MEIVFSLLTKMQEIYSDPLKEDIFSTSPYNLIENILTNKEEMTSYTQNYH